MRRLGINYEEVRKYIIDSRLNGKTDQEIYSGLKDKENDKRTIARMITGMVTENRKEKYRLLNSVLLIMILIIIIFKIIPVIKMVPEIRNPGDFFLLLLFCISPLIGIYFFYVVYRYIATMYPVIGFLAIFSLINKLGNPEGGAHTIGQTIEGFKRIGETINTMGIDYWIRVVLLCGIIFLSFYLKRKLLPNKPRLLIQGSEQ